MIYFNYHFHDTVEITTQSDHKIHVKAELRHEDCGIFEENICLTDYKIIKAELVRMVQDEERRRPIKLSDKLASLVIDKIEEKIKNEEDDGGNDYDDFDYYFRYRY